MQWTDPQTGVKHSIYPTEEFSQDIHAWSAQECHHEEKEMVWASDAGGRQHVRWQCRACFHLIGTPFPKTSAFAGMKNADPAEREARNQARAAALEAIYRHHAQVQQAQATDFKGQHAAYLGSPQWQKKRALVMKRANHSCEGCGEKPATQVHHLTYEHWQDELLFELVALCDGCHARCHPDADDAELDQEIEFE